ncbi:MAG: hypothetical protein AAGM38_10710 [Pseudomonadota bacterium]
MNVFGKILCASALSMASLVAIAPSSASAQVNCRLVQGIGRAVEFDILQQANNALPYEERLSKRKRLRVNGVDQVNFSGCQVSLRANVHLKRKIRRDAHGHIWMVGQVTDLNIGDRRVCISNIRLNRVKLSRTMRVGEAIYRKVANNRIPRRICSRF